MTYPPVVSPLLKSRKKFRRAARPLLAIAGRPMPLIGSEPDSPTQVVTKGVHAVLGLRGPRREAYSHVADPSVLAVDQARVRRSDPADSGAGSQTPLTHSARLELVERARRERDREQVRDQLRDLEGGVRSRGAGAGERLAVGAKAISAVGAGHAGQVPSNVLRWRGQQGFVGA